MKEEELLGWLIHQKKHSEIPDITDEMMDLLIESQKYLAVLFCKLCTTPTTSKYYKKKYFR